jgi:hypothetical protein
MRLCEGIVFAALIAALGGCETSRDDEATGEPNPAPRALTEEGWQAYEARAVQCLEGKDWDCAATNLRAADQLTTEPLTATRERLVAALEAEARSREKAIEQAKPGRDRLVAAQDAAATWTLWSDVSGKAQPASAKRVAKIVAREEAAAARSPTQRDAPRRSVAPARECCRYCTTGCPCGDSCISCLKTCRKGPGCAC